MLLKKRIELSGHSAAIYTIDGIDNFIYTGSGDTYVAKWNLLKGTQEKFSIKTDSSVYKIKLLISNKILAIGTLKGSLHLIDLLNKKEIKHFKQHQSAIFEIQENPSKNQFYTTDANGNLAIWDLKTYELLIFIPLESGKIRRILTSEDGKYIYLACQNGEIKKFDTTHFNEINYFVAHESSVNCLNFHPTKKKTLISGGKDGFIKFWNLDNNNKLILEIPAHNFAIYQLDFFNENSYFVTISRDKSIKIWDTNTLKVLQKIERKHGGHSHSINAFWKKLESEFVTIGDDKRIIYWELE